MRVGQREQRVAEKCSDATDDELGEMDIVHLPIVIVSADLASAYAAAMLNRRAETSGTSKVFGATQATLRNPAMMRNSPSSPRSLPPHECA